MQHCLVAWYDTGIIDLANSDSTILGTEFAAAQVAAIADSVLARWPLISMVRIKDIILGCTEDWEPAEWIRSTDMACCRSAACLNPLEY